MERLRSRPRFPLAAWPTPIHRLERPGPVPEPLWVKRDDLSGFGRGGAKARKIEHLLGHLLSRGFDELVTAAGNVTNLAFDLLPALERCGIRPTLLIADDPPSHAAIREQIFREIRGCVRLVGSRRSEVARAAVGAWLRGRAAGRRPFLLLPGASHPAAVVGNACGFLEMAAQLEETRDPLPRAVFVTVATGTTLAGFLLGEAALRAAGGPPVRIVGVQVYPGSVRKWTLALLRWTERFLGLELSVPVGRIEIVTSVLHGGFGRFPDHIAETCGRVRETVGLRIDPIFGGKTWSIMEDWIRGGGVGEAVHPSLRRGGERGPVLYWHCGYTPEWRRLAGSLRPGKAAA